MRRQHLESNGHSRYHVIAKRFKRFSFCVKPGSDYHRRVPLTDGRAKFAQVYPEGLVRAIIRGLLSQLRSQHAAVLGLTVGPINQEEDIDFSLFSEATDDDWHSFTDEVSGKPLNSKLVEAARAEKLD